MESLKVHKLIRKIEKGLKSPVYRCSYSKVQSYAGLECVCQGLGDRLLLNTELGSPWFRKNGTAFKYLVPDCVCAVEL